MYSKESNRERAIFFFSFQDFPFFFLYIIKLSIRNYLKKSFALFMMQTNKVFVSSLNKIKFLIVNVLFTYLLIFKWFQLFYLFIFSVRLFIQKSLKQIRYNIWISSLTFVYSYVRIRFSLNKISSILKICYD